VTGKSRLQQIEEMLAEDPSDPELRYALAMEYISARQDEQAVRCFEDLSRDRPDYVPAYFQRAQALIRLGRSREVGPIVEQGVAAARAAGNYHAADELQGLLAGLE
jgi:hypothetical protein